MIRNHDLATVNDIQALSAEIGALGERVDALSAALAVTLPDMITRVGALEEVLKQAGYRIPEP